MIIKVRCAFEIDVEIPDLTENIKWAIEDSLCPGTGFVGAALDRVMADAKERGVCWACNLNGENKIIS